MRRGLLAARAGRRPAGRRQAGRRVLGRRLLVLLGAAAVLTALASGPAALAASREAQGAPAAPFSSCTAPPQAAAADEVAAGVLDPASADLPAPLRNKAPAGARPATTELDLWGWTGFAWPDYDPGSSFGSCTLGAASHVEDTVVGFVARAQLETLVWACAATTGVARTAYDPHRYDVLQGIESTLRGGLGDGVAKVLFPLAAAVVGGWLVLTAERRTPREQARHAGGVVLLGVSVVLVAVWTLTLGPRLDDQVTRAVTWVTATVNRTPTGSDPGREIGESLRTNLVEPTWRHGVFGTVEGPTAQQFGPALLHSAAISNQERADLAAEPKVGGDPQKLATALAGLSEAKSQAYDRFAADLKTKDPRAYLVLSGSHNDRRLWAATVGWISFWGVAAVQWLASVLSIWCLTILRLIVQAWPAVALLGLVRRRAAVRVLGIAVGAAVADVGVSAVAAVERVGMKAVLAWQADGGGVAALVLAVVVAALSLWACWPFVRCVPGMPRRIRQLALPFTGRAPRPLPARAADADAVGDPALGRSGDRMPALPGRGERPGDAPVYAALPAEAAPGREVAPTARRAPELLPVGAPATARAVAGPASGGGALGSWPGAGERAPGERPTGDRSIDLRPFDVRPADVPTREHRSLEPRPVESRPVEPRPPRAPLEEPPWTSVPSAVPSTGASPRSAPGPRGLPAGPSPSPGSARPSSS